MAANNDNAMTRFLFAILRQKNLKDIDWTQVAHDPILGEGKKITNGHAARMRYSRFKNAMLGLEPTRRNRTGQPKSRVTKSKREPRAKKDESFKSEGTPDSPEPQDSCETPPRIKQESSPYSFENRLTPRLTPGPGPMPPTSNMTSTPGVIQPRLLTPCSDDMFSPSPPLMSSPTSDLINTPQGSFDFRGSPCPDRPDPMWTSIPSYPAFSPSYPFDDYGAGPCDHPHMHPHQQAHLGLPSQVNEPDGDWADVKREPWDDY
ncbi:hypothetical protein F4804DRAFT_283767 [Jackrogersella minutella]|nr:hypothetical protein F4804DRAFT_283767 [Jackrogersella minutella]